MVAGTGTLESMPMDSTNAVIVLVANNRRMVLLPREATSSYHMIQTGCTEESAI